MTFPFSLLIVRGLTEFRFFCSARAAEVVAERYTHVECFCPRGRGSDVPSVEDCFSHVRGDGADKARPRPDLPFRPLKQERPQQHAAAFRRADYFLPIAIAVMIDAAMIVIMPVVPIMIVVAVVAIRVISAVVIITAMDTPVMAVVRLRLVHGQ